MVQQEDKISKLIEKINSLNSKLFEIIVKDTKKYFSSLEYINKHYEGWLETYCEDFSSISNLHKMSKDYIQNYFVEQITYDLEDNLYIDILEYLGIKFESYSFEAFSSDDVVDDCISQFFGNYLHDFYLEKLDELPSKIFVKFKKEDLQRILQNTKEVGK